MLNFIQVLCTVQSLVPWRNYVNFRIYVCCENVGKVIGLDTPPRPLGYIPGYTSPTPWGLIVEKFSHNPAFTTGGCMGNAPPSRPNLNVFQLINAEILEKTFISHFSIV